MRRAALLCLPAALLVLAGCAGGQEESDGDAPAAASSTSTAPTSAASPTSSSSGGDYDLDLAVDICTNGLSPSDTLIFDAAAAARASTRTEAEILDMFREAQDSVEDQADRAGEGELPRLEQSLQTYADTMGQARVSGTATFSDITTAREAIDVACFLPNAPAT